MARCRVQRTNNLRSSLCFLLNLLNVKTFKGLGAGGERILATAIADVIQCFETTVTLRHATSFVHIDYLTSQLTSQPSEYTLPE